MNHANLLRAIAALEELTAVLRAELGHNAVVRRSHKHVHAEVVDKPAQRPIPIVGTVNDDDVPEGYSKVELRLLRTLVSLGGVASLALLGTCGGFAHKTGPVGTALAKLRRTGLLEGTTAALRVLPAGREVAGDVLPLPHGHKLLEFWCERIGSPGDKILRGLNQTHGTATIEEVGKLMGFAPRTGPVGTAIAKLRRIGFIEGSSKALNLTNAFQLAIGPHINIFDRATGRETLVRVERSK